MPASESGVESSVDRSVCMNKDIPGINFSGSGSLRGKQAHIKNRIWKMMIRPNSGQNFLR